MNKRGVGLFLVLAALAGFILRLANIREQVLMDDEWHSIYFVPGKDFWALLQPIVGANSIPINLYQALLLRLNHFSELSMRMPSIAAGIFSLIIFPPMIARIFNRHTAFVFTCLMAISPFLVFYSRNARPYMPVCFLSFFAILSFYFWVTGGRQMWRIHYLWASVLACFYNLTALPSVLVPLMASIAVFMRPGILQTVGIRSPLRQLILTLVLLCSMTGLLYIPAFRDAGWFVIATDGSATVDRKAFGVFLSLLSGTQHVFLIVISILGVFLGAFRMIKEKPAFAFVLGNVLLINILMMFFVKQDELFGAIVFTRYFIVLFPIAFILIAHAFEWLKIKKIRPLAEAAFIIGLFLFGPLPRIYAFPNNFTLHSAYQQDYSPIDWRESRKSEVFIMPQVSEDEIPSFYKEIANDPAITSIIEYPMLIADSANFLYYYQHFHKKKVLVGFLPMVNISSERTVLFADAQIDYAVQYIKEHTGKFRTLVNLARPEAVKRSGASHIVFHKRVKAKEEFSVTMTRPAVEFYRRKIGEPIYEDEKIAVFDLRGEAS